VASHPLFCSFDCYRFTTIQYRPGARISRLSSDQLCHPGRCNTQVMICSGPLPCPALKRGRPDNSPQKPTSSANALCFLSLRRPNESGPLGTQIAVLNLQKWAECSLQQRVRQNLPEKASLHLFVPANSRSCDHLLCFLVKSKNETIRFCAAHR
jgi:hypothetical protein